MSDTPTGLETETSIDPQLLPSAQDVEFYRQHGWWISPPIFTPAELKRACAIQDRFYAGDQPHPLPQVFPWSQPEDQAEHTPDPSALRKNDYSAFIQPELQLISHKPILAAIAAKLMGCDEIRLWHDQLLYKPPLPRDRKVDGLATVGWHADRNYWQTCTGPLITAWVPFTEVTPAMGPITYLDCSQEWELIDDLDFFSDDLAGQETLISNQGKNSKKIVPHFKLGQVGFHDWRTVHGSTTNTSDQIRRSMAVHLQAGENQWQEHHDREGKLSTHANDYLLAYEHDGPPDYRNPKWCPVLYKK